MVELEQAKELEVALAYMTALAKWRKCRTSNLEPVTIASVVV